MNLKLKCVFYSEYRLARRLFDPIFYLNKYDDLKSIQCSLFEHYMECGRYERRCPNSWFDPSHYLALNPDVLESALDPFLHYLSYGCHEGRHVLLSSSSRGSDKKKAKGKPALQKHPEVENKLYSDFRLTRSLFDPIFYLNKYEDLKGVPSPFQHYMEYGRYERRCPNSWFDPSHYLALNPDVLKSVLDPFQHYLSYGCYEGRRVFLSARPRGNNRNKHKEKSALQKRPEVKKPYPKDQQKITLDYIALRRMKSDNFKKVSY